MPESPMTVDQLMEHLKDPALLHAAAAKHGMKVVDPNDEPQKLPEPKKLRERPKFDISEDAEPKDFIAAIGKYLEDQTSYLEEQASLKTEEVRNEVKTSKDQQELIKIREFAKTHPDFKELLPIIDPLYSSGKFDLEEAYNLASKTKSKEPEKEDASKADEASSSASHKISSFSTSDEGGTPDKTKLTPKVKDTREAAKINLGKLIAADPSLQAAFNEDTSDE